MGKVYWLAPALIQLSVAGATDDASEPLAEPVLEAPTVHCLGVYWVIRGDDNTDATVGVEYRRTGADEWLTGPPLFRVEKGAHKPGDRESTLDVPDDAWLFAGSVMLLQPDTDYELRLALSDPDGGTAERVLTGRTMAEPSAATNAPRYHVTPGDGGGSGSEDDPYRGLEAAQARARPGDVFLLGPGVYEGTFTVSVSGELSQPIIWRGAGDGPAIIDGKGDAAERPGRGISAGDVHDVCSRV